MSGGSSKKKKPTVDFIDLITRGPVEDYSGPNPYFPVMNTQYSPPLGGGLLSDLYAPWSEASLDYVPEGIWSGAETEPLTGLGYGVRYNAPKFGNIVTKSKSADSGSGDGIYKDTSGNEWVMTPEGDWISADSDYGQALIGNSRLFYDQHYDQSGDYVGYEGTYYDPDTGREMLPSGVRAPGKGHIKDLDMWALPHKDKKSGKMVKGKMISSENKLAHQQKAGTFGKNVPSYINTGKTGDAWSYKTK